MFSVSHCPASHPSAPFSLLHGWGLGEPPGHGGKEGKAVPGNWNTLDREGERDIGAGSGGRRLSLACIL